ncbi:hypothetical protein D9757_008652 [Collybiopsis confluens]|uniref:Carbonic anhydrase n=1 Tax=Collybiopsis confluens TaxID=2823264 RepID=A0A8H5H4G7_9AGAR|nr:hypothetical protein D9757_008652 [Collybiopsis confluens]
MSFHPHMIEMLERNEEWAQGVEDKDPDFFPNSARGQNPHTLWIGCADSRVPESVITAAMPGDIFVNRNIGNQVHLDDNNMLAVLTFAIEHLNVNHVVVCGHSNCGAAAASLEASSSVVPGKTPITIPTDAPDAPLNVWLAL